MQIARHTETSIESMMNRTDPSPRACDCRWDARLREAMVWFTSVISTTQGTVIIRSVVQVLATISAADELGVRYASNACPPSANMPSPGGPT